MQPVVQCCGVYSGVSEEEFVDFETAHHYSITTSEDWTLTELDEVVALGVEPRSNGSKVRTETKVMKASISDEDDANRTYSSFNKTRPTMISAKYRLKEERRKVLKISINKLKKIEDPESSLRRSVLINNTMKRLQREARDERREKQTLHSFPRYTPSFKSFVMKEEPVKPVEMVKPDADKENASPYPSERKAIKMETIEELVDITTLEETPEEGGRGKKRAFEEVEDSEIHDVLSQFYMPPTPRMLTSIDDDEDEEVNVVDVETEPQRIVTNVLGFEDLVRSELEDATCKRPRFEFDFIEAKSELDTGKVDCEVKTVENRRITSISEAMSWTSMMSDELGNGLCKTLSDCCYNGQEMNNNSLVSEPSKFSCAHAAITQLQSAVQYHSFVASMES